MFQPFVCIQLGFMRSISLSALDADICRLSRPHRKKHAGIVVRSILSNLLLVMGWLPKSLRCKNAQSALEPLQWPYSG